MNNEELKHYGVTGMRWRNRKGPRPKTGTGRRPAQQRAKSSSSPAEKVSVGKTLAIGALKAVGGIALGALGAFGFTVYALNQLDK